MGGSYCIDISSLYETGQPDFKSQVGCWQVLTVLTLPIYVKLGSLISKVRVSWWWVLTVLTLLIYLKLGKDILKIDCLGGGLLLY